MRGGADVQLTMLAGANLTRVDSLEYNVTDSPDGTCAVAGASMLHGAARADRPHNYKLSRSL